MRDALFGLAFSIIYVFLCMLFANCFVEKRNISKTNMYFYFVIWILFIMAISYLGMNHTVIKIFLVPLCSALFLCFLQKSTIIQAIVLCLIYYCLVLGVDYLMIVVYNYMLGNYNVSMAANSVTSVLMGIISQIVLFIIILIISYFRENKFLDFLDKKDLLKIGTFPIFSIMALSLLAKNFADNNSEKQNYSLMIISFGLLGLNFFVLIVMREIMIREAKIREAQVMYERASNTAQKYFDKAKTSEEQRKREHEFKNHLAVIHSLICNSEYERAKSYAEELSEQNENSTDIIDMNHPIVNSVVNTKYKEALAKGIFMSFDVCDISDIGISDNDITIIISNLLSNAIEACEKDCDDNSFIRFKINKDEKYLCIAVKNSYSHLANPIIRNDIYLTTKKDKLMHGYGIRNITDTVKRNNGEYVIDASDNIFNFVIHIPL